ncbi:MAG: NADH-quinone oxidoreductase subunit J [Acidobacteria bacterium]|nr:NADH-quinone oxidoreductase subunit J [Acidobacteriota bacterium]
MDAAFFWIFALMVLAGAVLTVALRNAVHCAVALIVSLLGTAGLYLLLRAEFLFATQIILYIGGVMLLFLFVIMLINLDESRQERHFIKGWWLGVALAVGTGAIGLRWAVDKPWPGPAGDSSGATGGNTERLADLLFSEYLVPFEAISLLLLVAIVGSVLMARPKPSPGTGETPAKGVQA